MGRWKEAKQLLMEDEKDAEEKLDKLKGPIIYMICGIICMLIAISIVIKVVFCGKGTDLGKDKSPTLFRSSWKKSSKWVRQPD